MSRHVLGVVVVASALGVLRPLPAAAIPVLAHIYDKPCATCHTVFPELNPEGENFRAHGFHGLHPAVKPLRVGPSFDVPGTLPLAFYFGLSEDISRTKSTGQPRSAHENFNVPLLSLLSGGELGPHLAYFLDYEVLETERDTGALSVNSLPEQAYLQAHAEPFGWLGNLRLGWLELPLGISPRIHRLSVQPYIIYGISGCGLLDQRPPGLECDDVPVLRQPQIAAELSGQHPASGFGWSAGVTNGSNNRLHHKASRDFYTRIGRQIGLHKVGVFFFYSPDILGVGPRDRTLRVGPDFTWYTRQLQVFGQFLANHESNPTGHANGLWAFGGFIQCEYRLTPELLGLVRGDYAWTPKFDDTPKGGETQVRRRLWEVTGGGQWLLRENLKLVAEGTYGENREAVTGVTEHSWSMTVRVVTAFWALEPFEAGWQWWRGEEVQ